MYYLEDIWIIPHKTDPQTNKQPKSHPHEKRLNIMRTQTVRNCNNAFKKRNVSIQSTYTLSKESNKSRTNAIVQKKNVYTYL